MKHLILIIVLFLGLLSFTTFPHTEYDKFLSGEPVEFVIDEKDGTSILYNFQAIKPLGFQLLINNKMDGIFYLKSTKDNTQIVIYNVWGEFQFNYTKGILISVVQEIYKNEKFNIDNFTITFDL